MGRFIGLLKNDNAVAVFAQMGAPRAADVLRQNRATLSDTWDHPVPDFFRKPWLSRPHFLFSEEELPGKSALGGLWIAGRSNKQGSS
jgi:hypothetical protein